MERQRIGSSDLRKPYLDDLRRAWKERRLALFLGAGVSIPYGMPTWEDLVLDLLIEDESGRFSGFWPPYRRALGDWMVEHFDFSPLMLARAVKYNLRARHPGVPHEELQRLFAEILRTLIYRNYVHDGNGVLPDLAAMLEQSENEDRRVRNIISFNYDDLLEVALKGRVHFQSFAEPCRRKGDVLPIVHVHGFLPRNGSGGPSELVFTEDDYHRLTYSPFHWALGEIAASLRNYTVLMIGLSLSDPSLRRLLDATHADDEGITHYLIRKAYSLNDWEKHEITVQIEKRAEHLRKRMNRPNDVKGPQEIGDAIDVALRSARKYDREVFKDLGVGTLWIESWTDIPALLKYIRGVE